MQITLNTTKEQSVHGSQPGCEVRFPHLLAVALSGCVRLQVLLSQVQWERERVLCRTVRMLYKLMYIKPLTWCMRTRKNNN